MPPLSENRQAEIDANYQVFLKMLPDLIEEHPGKFALMRHKKILDFFDTARDAMIYATRTYEDGIFSIQEITRDIVDLGWFSHAPHYAAV